MELTINGKVEQTRTVYSKKDSLQKAESWRRVYNLYYTELPWTITITIKSQLNDESEL